MNLSSWVAQDETGIPQGVSLGPEKSPPSCFEASCCSSVGFFWVASFPKFCQVSGLLDPATLSSLGEGDPRRAVGAILGPLSCFDKISETWEKVSGLRAVRLKKNPFLFWVYGVCVFRMHVKISTYTFLERSFLILCSSSF